MQPYRPNKFKTVWQIIQRIENWPEVLDMRWHQQRDGLRMIRFRNGLNVVCRAGTRDWDVVHELMFVGSYGRALAYLGALKSSPVVLDLGGNIGLFSLLAASAHPQARVTTYEPGPPNRRVLEMNLLTNPRLAARLCLCREAVAGYSGTAEWTFDEANPGGSGLYATGGSKFPVTIRSFAEVIESLSGPVDLVKIDIEGAEFDLLERTPERTWSQVQAIALELHDDPRGQMARTAFLTRMRELGFQVEEERMISLFLHR